MLTVLCVNPTLFPKGSARTMSNLKSPLSNLSTTVIKVKFYSESVRALVCGVCFAAASVRLLAVMWGA